MQIRAVFNVAVPARTQAYNGSLRRRHLGQAISLSFRRQQDGCGILKLKIWWKEFFSIHKNDKIPELKALAKQNNLHYTCLNKDEIIELLIDNKIIITPKDLLKSKVVLAVERREVEKGRYEYLKGIRNHPKTVEIFDTQTSETSVLLPRIRHDVNFASILDGLKTGKSGGNVI